jgi:hypothetical protein
MGTSGVYLEIHASICVLDFGTSGVEFKISFLFLRAMRTSGVYSEVHSSTFSRLVARKASISKSTVPNFVVYGASGIDFEIHESEFCGLWEPPDSVLKSMLQNCPGGQLAASASISKSIVLTFLACGRQRRRFQKHVSSFPKLGTPACRFLTSLSKIFWVMSRSCADLEIHHFWLICASGVDFEIQVFFRSGLWVPAASI